MSRLNIKQVFGLLAILGLIQSAFTNIGYDEAYYWRFAQDLDWGYFDHPPMVALMIAIGDLILPGTIGLRLMTVVLSILTYYFLWLLIPSKSRDHEHAPWLFLLLILASPLLNIYSFITTPDVPLIFFSVLYIYLFQKFIEKQSFKSALILGLVMSCLIYSKYHGLLVILITVATRPKLFLKPYFYLAGIFGIILYLPHLYWQYLHDFVSFNYHLSYRSVLFNIKNVYVYFINTVLVLNPFLFPLFLIYYFRYGWNKGYHNRTMNALLWVFLGFFAFTSFRGHVEPQWIVVVSIPILVYLHQYGTEISSIRKYLNPLLKISVVLVLIARVFIMIPLPIESEFHKPDRVFYETVKELAFGSPVVFANSYTQSSRYAFYTGDPSYSYNFVSFRKNQYDLWNYQDLLHKEDVFFCTLHDIKDYKDTLIDNSDRLYYKWVKSFPLVNNLEVEVLDYQSEIKEVSNFQIKFKVHNPYPYDVDFNELSIRWMIYFFYMDKERAYPAYMTYGKFTTLDKDGHQSEFNGINAILKAKSTTEVTGIFEVKVPADQYTFGVHIHPQEIFPITLGKRTNPITVVK